MPTGVFKNPKERSKKISKAIKRAYTKGLKFGFQKGHLNFQTEESKKKIGEFHRGRHRSEETKRKMREKRKYQICTEETRKKMSEQRKGKQVGSLNPAWKGGLTSLVHRLRRSYKYRQWRSDIFTRDDFTCQECRIRGIYLEAHHIKSLVQIMSDNSIKNYKQAMECEELWNINNGITLCKNCHSLTDNYKGHNKCKFNYE